MKNRMSKAIVYALVASMLTASLPSNVSYASNTTEAEEIVVESVSAESESVEDGTETEVQETELTEKVIELEESAADDAEPDGEHQGEIEELEEVLEEVQEESETDEERFEEEVLIETYSLLSDPGGLSLAWYQENVYSASVDLANKTISCQDYKDLILLTQVNPAEYADFSITLYQTNNFSVILSDNSTATGTTDGVSYTAKQFGSEEAPFSGSFTCSTPIETDKALFACLGSAALSELTFVRTVDSVDSAILAEYYCGQDKSYSLNINKSRDPETGAEMSYSYAGIIGTMKEGSSLSLTIRDNTIAPILSSNDAGWICNRMEAGAQLTIAGNLSAANRSIKSGIGSCAGGLVGYAGEGTSIVVNSDYTFFGTVEGGHAAGGVLGAGVGVTVLSAGTISVVNATISAADYVGGYIGEYVFDGKGTNSFVIEDDLLKIQGNRFAGEASTVVGGFLGNVQNSTVGEVASTKALSISGSGMVSSAIISSVAEYGGLIGNYSASDLKGTLHINGVGEDAPLRVSTVKENIFITNYGGLIGAVNGTDSAAYIKVEDIAVTTSRSLDADDEGNVYSYDDINKSVTNAYGGIVAVMKTKGHFLDVKNIKVNALNKYQGSKYAGGIVGYSDCGVIRIQGTTDFTDCAPANTTWTDYANNYGYRYNVEDTGKDIVSQKRITPGNYYGQLVGYRSDTLVYANGDGNGAADANGNLWAFERYKYKVNTDGEAYAVSDIGDWGEVIRRYYIGDRKNDIYDAIDESAADTEHIVSLCSFSLNEDGSITITANSMFASLALNIQLNSREGGYDSLQFASNTALLVEETFTDGTKINTLKKNITLRIPGNELRFDGTGLTGLLRDDGTQQYEGVFRGRENDSAEVCSIHMNMGETYGRRDGAAAESYCSGQIYNHSFMGFIARAMDVEVYDVSIQGVSNFALVSKGVAIYSGPLIARVDGNLFVSGVSVGVKVTYMDMTTAVDNAIKSLKISDGTEDSELRTRNVPHCYNGGIIGFMPGSQKADFVDCVWMPTAAMNFQTQCSTIYCSGFIGCVFDGGADISFRNCQVSGSINQCEKIDGYEQITCMKKPNVWIGRDAGLIAFLGGTEVSSVTVDGLLVDGCSITTYLTSNANASCGGFLGHTWQNCRTKITGILVQNSSIRAEITNGNFGYVGGLLNASSGKIEIYANESGKYTTYGVEYGTGETANTFYCSAQQTTSSALLVCRTEKFYNISKNDTDGGLYLTIGENAYIIEEDSVDVYLSGSYMYFDDIAGKTIGADNAKNGLVSIETDDDVYEEYGYKLINQNKLSTWKSGICNVYKVANNAKVDYVNPCSRYYYNIESIRKTVGVDENDLSTLAISKTNLIDNGAEFLLWSIGNYVQPGIKTYFLKSTSEPKLTGNIDLTGLSYYPIATALNVVDVILTFDAGMIGRQILAEDKYLSKANSQHFMMQSGLFLYFSGNTTITNVTLRGSISPVEVKTGFSSYNRVYNAGSGAICVDQIEGSASGIRTVTLSGIILDGIYVCDGDTSDLAPLLINHVGNYATVNIINGKNVNDPSDVRNIGIGTTAAYSENSETKYAATSLIGKAGNAQNASDIHLNFLGQIVLDARDSSHANKELISDYGTYHSIFTHATLLESLEHPSSVTSCGGQYIFNSSDLCTFGKELANALGTQGSSWVTAERNPYDGGSSGQVWYYDTFGQSRTTVAPYTWVTDSYESSVIYGSGFASGYLRYVYIKENAEQNSYELDVNQKVINLTNGCGTYGDPFIISNGDELMAVMNFLDGSIGEGFTVCLNKTILNGIHTGGENKNAISASNTNFTFASHTMAEREASQEQKFSDDSYYIYSGGNWYEAERDQGNPDQYNATGKQLNYTDRIRAYLRNAYYMIAPEEDADSNPDYSLLMSRKFNGIGGFLVNSSSANAFSGVIVGKPNGEGKYPTLVMMNADDSYTTFGGIVRNGNGCVVKDLNIDYSRAEINISAEKTSSVTTAVVTQNYFGGVIGFVIGGDNIIDHVSVKYGENSLKCASNLIPVGGYVGQVGAGSTAGGGVIFRHMDNEGETLSYVSGTDGDYYWNPYVGRVLDGFACYDSRDNVVSKDAVIWLDNTEKNYVIPNLTTDKSSLTVNSYSKNTSSVPVINVGSAQDLWILSAIVNSGAGSMRADSNVYSYPTSAESYPYAYGKVRTASYDTVGQNGTAPSDERWLGGSCYSQIVNGIEKTPYLAYYFSNSQTINLNNVNYTVYPVVRVTGTSSVFELDFSADCDMSQYGNGFRGIGTAYQIYTTAAAAQRRQINIKIVYGGNHTVTYGRTVKEYDADDKWHMFQMGLFNAFYCGTFDGTVKDLQIHVNDLSINAEEKGYLATTTAAVGGFTGALLNGSGKNITFENVVVSGSSTEQNALLNGARYVGGIVGYINYGGAHTFTDCEAHYLEGKGYYVAGGFVGATTKSLIVNGTADKSSSNLALRYEIGDNGANYGAGGILGYTSNTVSVRNITVSDISAGGLSAGGIIGRANSSTSITDCIVSQLTISVNKAVSKDAYCGGIVGFQNGIVSVDRVKVNGLDAFVLTNNGGNNFGGIIGYTNNADTVIRNAAVTAARCAVKGRAGGVIGYSNYGAEIQNASLMHSKLATFVNDQYVGGMVGFVNNNTLSVHNALSYENILGILMTTNSKGQTILDTTATAVLNNGNVDLTKLSTATIALRLAKNAIANNYVSYDMFGEDATKSVLSTSSSTGIGIGIWVGGTNGKDVYITAASRYGAHTALNDIGFKQTANSLIIYGDYAGFSGGKITNETKRDADLDLISPYVVSTPGMKLADSDGEILAKVSSNGIGALTVNAEGVITSSVPSMVINDISADYQKKYTTAYLKGYQSNIKLFTDGLWKYADKVSTYRATEQDGDYYKGIAMPEDFPILIVDNPTTVDEQIDSYIAMLTNSSYSKMAYRAETYRWDGEAWSLVVDDGGNSKPNLIYRNNQWYVRQNSYDNGNGQFTMVYATYTNPVKNYITYTIGIPMYVQKVLQFEFYASVLPGTTYAEKPYTYTVPQDASAAMVSYGDSLTVRLTYTYTRSAEEWKNLLNSGENLCYAFDNKAVWLEDENSQPLPVGTEFYLVDPLQKKQSAYYGYLASISSNPADITANTGVKLLSYEDNGRLTKLSFNSFAGFEDSYICDLLQPTAKEGGGAFVKAVTPDQATVRCYENGVFTYYTWVGEGAGDYEIEIHPNIDAYGRMVQMYYLTIKTQKNAAQNLINSQFIFADGKLDNSNRISTQKSNNMVNGNYYYTQFSSSNENRFLIQNFFDTNLEVSSVSDSTLIISQDESSISVDLVVKDIIDLKDAVTYRNYSTDSSALYHRFVLNATDVASNGTAQAVTLSAGTKYTITYVLTDKDNNQIGEPHQKSGTLTSDSASLIFDTFEGESIRDLFADKTKQVYDEVQIHANITLAYDEATLWDQFRVRTGDEDKNYGLRFDVTSKLATQRSSLAVTSMSKTENPGYCFARETIELSKLNLSAYEYIYGERSGEVSHLGINAFKNDDYDELISNPSPIFASATYDVTSMSADAIAGAKKIRCSLQLYVKNGDGEYILESPLNAEEYLRNVTIRGVNAQYDAVSKSYIVVDALSVEEQDSYLSNALGIDLYYEVLSGNLMPGTYANYKIVLTADLADANNHLMDIAASDYLIYTNAKIDPSMQ